MSEKSMEEAMEEQEAVAGVADATPTQGISTDDAMCIAWLFMEERKTCEEIALLLGVSEGTVRASLAPRHMGENYEIIPWGPARSYANAIRDVERLNENHKSLFAFARVAAWEPKPPEHILAVILTLVPMLTRQDLLLLIVALSDQVADAYEAPFRELCTERGYIPKQD